jgi:hypothetical protein
MAAAIGRGLPDPDELARLIVVRVANCLGPVKSCPSYPQRQMQSSGSLEVMQGTASGEHRLPIRTPR